MKKSNEKNPESKYEVQFFPKGPYESGGEKITVIAKTRSQAKYKAYKQSAWEESHSYDEFFRCYTKIKKIGPAVWKKEDFYPKNQASRDMFNRILKQRSLEEFCKLGTRVKSLHSGRFGFVVGGNQSGNIDVLFDGSEWTNNCHPHWQMQYLSDDGKTVLKEYGG